MRHRGRLLLLVLGFSFPCFSDSLQTMEAAAIKECELYRTVQRAEFPQKYPQKFLDSLALVKKCSPAIALRSMEGKPFVKGEILVYDVGWGVVSAGHAVIETRPDSAGGLVTIIGKGMTNSFFNTFYTVRDYYITTMDTTGMYPLFFEEHIKEGGYKDNRWLLFDQAHSQWSTRKKKKQTV